MCAHNPPCPTAMAPDREAARPVAHRPEQGWSLLCNGVLVFEDTGELLPDGRIVAPTGRSRSRSEARHDDHRSRPGRSVHHRP
ncbi:DUF5999 family protein [Streptomyces sanglieri]|uniref:DUF5999 family protein n=1 Tax=Streptomyces sanglieri TaxID=193460 RepID=A0ABW2X8J5_9ACTN